jgi:hypothetical protein
MPLTPTGEEVLQRFKKEYGDKEGESHFYAKINSGDKEAQTWHSGGKKKPGENTVLSKKTAAEVRKKQGAGFWQAEIE